MEMNKTYVQDMYILYQVKILLLQTENSFKNEQEPRNTVHKKIKPVYGPHQAALEQHLQLFNKMWRVKGRQPKGQAGNNKQTPRQRIHKFFHG